MHKISQHNSGAMHSLIRWNVWWMPKCLKCTQPSYSPHPAPNRFVQAHVRRWLLLLLVLLVLPPCQCRLGEWCHLGMVGRSVSDHLLAAACWLPPGQQEPDAPGAWAGGGSSKAHDFRRLSSRAWGHKVKQ